MDMKRKSVPVYEQETHISYMRDEQIAKVYTSDTTQMTRYDKLVKQFPDIVNRLRGVMTGLSLSTSVYAWRISGNMRLTNDVGMDK